MNYKKMLAATAVTSAAIILPSLVAEASESGINVTPGQNTTGAKINSTITADINKLPAGTIVQSYEWYIVETKTFDGNSIEVDTKIANASSYVLPVPIDAAGKKVKLIVKANNSEGVALENFTSVIDVLNFKLNIADTVELIGINGSMKENTEPTEYTAAPGDTVTIGKITLEDDLGKYKPLELTSSQVSYSYQWYEKSSEGNVVYSKIENATSRTFTIPANADKTTLNHFFVEITAHVNGQAVTKMSQTMINVGNALTVAGDLNKLIQEIQGKDYGVEPVYLNIYDSSNKGDFVTFKEYINNLIAQYNKLTPNTKKLVTNYPMLTEALANITLVEKLVADISKVTGEDLPTDLTELTSAQLKQFTKDFQPLFARYEQLDSLQRSLLGETTELIEAYNTLLKDTDNFGPQADISGITKINNAIAKLYNPVLEFNADTLRDSYNLDGSIETTYKTPVLYIDAKVKELNAELKTINSAFKPLVYTNLLKQAQIDVIKVQAFIKKVEKIDTSVAAKKVSAATAALKDYKKLTTLQRSLVNDAFAKIQDALGATTDGEEPDENPLTTRIAYFVDTETSTYMLLESSVTAHLAVIDSMLAEYKGYTSAKKKLITNYSLLTQAQKDAKVALKVEKLMLELMTLNNSIDSSANDKDKLKVMSKAISKYKSTLTAYSKLTPLQQSLLFETFVSILSDYGSLVTDYNELNVSMKPVKELVPEKEETFNYDGVKDLVADITALVEQDNQLVYYVSDLLSFKDNIRQLLADYKVLDSKEKKAVYNYSVLSKASSDIKKAESTVTTIQKALATKSYDKVLSAQASYNKLSSFQQSLVRASHDGSFVEDMNTLLAEAVEVVGNILDLIDSSLKEPETNPNYIIATINELNEQYSQLSSKLKKQVPNYGLLKEAIKDTKAVQSFVTKLLKVTEGSPLKNKESILTSYYNLTAAQTNLFKNSFDDTDYVARLNAFEQESLQKGNAAEDLNRKIGELVTGETYSEVSEGTFAAYITSLQSEYKALSSADKKLVTNYSILTKAQSNITAVLKVVDQYYALPKDDTDIIDITSSNYKAFEKSYNKLNKLQLSLYKILDDEYQYRL